MKEGISRLDEPKYSPWWGSHQIQLLYISFPSLETMLRLIPGAFSLWLRLWGSRVGRGVYWTPLVQILDRSLLEIGDHCVFGHQVNCSGHVIKPSAERMILFVRKVRVGNGVFIGAGSRLGPGAYVEDKVQLPALTDLFVNKRATAESIEETE